jgi:hypothetical protein
VLHAFTLYLPVSSPSSLPLDPDVVVAPEADAAQEPDDSVDDLALAAEQPGKHPHFEHSDIAYSLLSIACIRIVTATALPTLLHSLFNCNLHLIPACYPKLLSLGWVELYQRPIYPDCPAGFSEDPFNGIEDQTWAPHITTLPLVARLRRDSIE